MASLKWGVVLFFPIVEASKHLQKPESRVDFKQQFLPKMKVTMLHASAIPEFSSPRTHATCCLS